MKPKVFVTRQIPEAGLDLLKEKCELEINREDRVLTKGELIKGVKQSDYLLSLLTDTIDAEIFDANPNLKIVANYAVGYNNIDVEEATKRGIIVTNTPGVLTDTTADFAWALLMAIARRVTEADKYTRAGKFKGWGPMLLLGSDVYGKTLGIVGFGRIGRAIAKRAKGFDMKVLYYDPFRADEETENLLNVKSVSLEELLKESDYVSIHALLIPETRHLIGAEQLAMMKNTAYLINAARGPIVDEKALAKALKNKQIAGAALDYEEEPALAPGLAGLDNVVLAPHIASASIETRSKMAVIAAENIIACLEGKKPPTIVNPEVLEKE
jgi:glyoxylate reductase